MAHLITVVIFPNSTLGTINSALKGYLNKLWANSDEKNEVELSLKIAANEITSSHQITLIYEILRDSMLKNVNVVEIHLEGIFVSQLVNVGLCLSTHKNARKLTIQNLRGSSEENHLKILCECFKENPNIQIEFKKLNKDTESSEYRAFSYLQKNLPDRVQAVNKKLDKETKEDKTKPLATTPFSKTPFWHGQDNNTDRPASQSDNSDSLELLTSRTKTIALNTLP